MLERPRIAEERQRGGRVQVTQALGAQVTRGHSLGERLLDQRQPVGEAVHPGQQDLAGPVEGHGRAGRQVARPVAERACLVEQAPAGRGVAQQRGQEPGQRQTPGPRRRGFLVRRERAGQPALTLPVPAGAQPQVLHRDRDLQRVMGAIWLAQPRFEGEAQVGQLAQQPPQPLHLVRGDLLGLGTPGQVPEVLPVSQACPVLLTGFDQPLAAVLAHGLQHPVPRAVARAVRALQHRLVQQPGHQLEDLVRIDTAADAHRLGGGQVEAGEDRGLGPQRPLLW